MKNKLISITIILVFVFSFFITTSNAINISFEDYDLETDTIISDFEDLNDKEYSNNINDNNQNISIENESFNLLKSTNLYTSPLMLLSANDYLKGSWISETNWNHPLNTTYTLNERVSTGTEIIPEIPLNEYTPYSEPKSDSGKHTYEYDRKEKNPITYIGKWKAMYSRGTEAFSMGSCIHQIGLSQLSMNGDTWYFNSSICGKDTLPCWNAYCLDCGQHVSIAPEPTLYYYNTSDVKKIYKVDLNGYYIAGCIHCGSLETAGEFASHICKGVSYNKYKIRYDGNGADSGYTSSTTHMRDNVSTYNGETISISTTLAKNEYIKTGYKFVGWYTEPVGGEYVGTNNSPILNYAGQNSDNETVTLYAHWEIEKYPVTYIDKVNSITGIELGRTTKELYYNSTVKGEDMGSDSSDNAYYNQYRYVSDTNAVVTTDGAIVYRIFEYCETEVKSNLQWNDNNNRDGFRPSKYSLKLKRNGEIIDEVELSSSETSHSFSNLPKYDENGDIYNYTLDIEANDRYQIDFDENNNIIFENYEPASFNVIIPKKITLDGNTGSSDYNIKVNGILYYNDTLTVKPENNFTMTDKDNISSIQANIYQQKTGFTKEDNISNEIITNGSIQVNETYFAGLWNGHFNFNIKFEMKN